MYLHDRWGGGADYVFPCLVGGGLDYVFTCHMFGMGVRIMYLVNTIYNPGWWVGGFGLCIYMTDGIDSSPVDNNCYGFLSIR